MFAPITDNVEVISERESSSFGDVLRGGFSDLIDGVLTVGQYELNQRLRDQYPEQFPEYGDGSRFYVDTRAAEDTNAQVTQASNADSFMSRIGQTFQNVDPVWIGAAAVAGLALFVFVRK